jgi:KipI family sensor histidine kinase inhibitor
MPTRPMHSESTPGIRVVPMGDCAILIVCGTHISEETTRRVRRIWERVRADVILPIQSWIPAYTTLLGYLDPTRAAASDVAKLISIRLMKDHTWLETDDSGQAAGENVIEIPVCYGGLQGPDLVSLARDLQLAPQDLVWRHAERLYSVAFIGFVPGFPYLLGLDDALEAPRRTHPRTKVPAGSVGIGGGQTGIYPLETPGGWNLIGRTPTRLFDPGRAQPSLLQPGDKVRFLPISEDQFHTLKRPSQATEASPPCVLPSAASLLVEQPGLLTTVQDLGRMGFGQFGVARAGAMDPFAAVAANLLVGNQANAALLECTLVGPVLRFADDTVIAVAGGEREVLLNGAAVPMWQAVRVKAGDRLSLAGRYLGARAYLAVAGGLQVDLVMGSASTDLALHLGGHQGRALRAGDGLRAHLAPTSARRRIGYRLSDRYRPLYGTAVSVGFVPTQSPASVRSEALTGFSATRFLVHPQSNRMGIRLTAETGDYDMALARPSETTVSEPVQVGTIQCPPESGPIVLMADAQTVGGYPTVGVVARAELPLLAQVGPGASVSFVPISEAEARARARRQWDCLRWLELWT